mmetsp:Transcript_97278/g.178270  ORF Transcript_97278/g.178270 Transcript_97278/m.178270 type:complete len:214 (-) Transcript_97278:358-999(-)
MLASETFVIAFPVLCNVLFCDFAECFTDFDDDVISACSTHLLDRKIGVAPSTIPITLLHWFRAEGAHNTVTFCHSQHDVAGHDHMVANLNSSARANLVLPLSRHHLCVDAGNLHARFHALCEVLFCNRTTNRDSSSCTCVVRALWGRLRAISVETVRNLRRLSDFAGLHESVLLLDAIPRIILGILLMHFSALCTSVPNSRGIIPSVPAVRQD